MDSNDLPLLPEGEQGPQVCAAVRLRLAVLDDLSTEEVQALYKHVHTCTACAAELRTLNQARRLVANLPSSTPSAGVDQAVMAALATRGRVQTPVPVHIATQRRKRGSLQLIGSLAAVAVLLFAVLTAVYVHTSQAFSIPASVSWSGYVLYHSETRVTTNGVHYQVESDHDLGTGRTHVETFMDNSLDVVVVGDSHTMLGMDMMHHVAQWNAGVWSVDDSLFDLVALRSDMQANRAVYLGKDHFRGQDVYRIRARDGVVLLLDMHYMPVNVLHSDTGTPLYDMLRLYPARQIASSMWDMSMPAGFRMGALPDRP